MRALNCQRRRALFFVVCMTAFAVLVLGASPAIAADYLVTKFEDTNDGVCDGDCSLREAVIAANAVPGADTILLSAGTYQLSISGIDEDACGAGDLDLLDDTTIIGVGREATTIDAGAIDRVLHVPGVRIDVTLLDLTVTNGDTTSYTMSGNGGAIFIRPQSSPPGRLRLVRVGVTDSVSTDGGGLSIWADTLIYRSIISSNSTPPGVIASGGGISAIFDTVYILESEIVDNQAHGIGGIEMYDGTVIIDRSTVRGNTAVYSAGVRNFIGDLYIRNSTISGNLAGGDGGAITITGTGVTLAIENSTIANNTGNPGGILNYGTVTLLTNSIVADNIGGDCSGDLGISGGHNVSSDASCGFTGPGDMQNTDPLLQPLQNNGGLTDTHGLDPASPAIDASDPAALISLDQRAFGRPADGDANGSFISDIGAFEYGAAPPVFYDSFESGDTSAWSATAP